MYGLTSECMERKVNVRNCRTIDLNEIKLSKRSECDGWKTKNPAFNVSIMRKEAIFIEFTYYIIF